MNRVRSRASIEKHLTENPHLSVEGRYVKLKIDNDPDSTAPLWRFDKKKDTISIHLNGSPHRELLLKATLREIAGHAIIPRVRQLGKKCHLNFGEVSIRDQRSRWGSCSARKALSLNWRLILLPPKLHDYVIYHELAHLKHYNHSDRYWKFLNELDPHSEIHDRELTQMACTIIPIGLGLK